MVGTAPVFTTASSATFTVGKTSTVVVRTLADPVATLAIDGCGRPSWLSFTPGGSGQALLSGEPPSGSAGTYHLVFRAENPIGTAVQDFTLVVQAATSTATGHHSTGGTAGPQC